jgi:hypothetical protein
MAMPIANIWLTGLTFYKKLVKALLEAKLTREEFERFSEQQPERIHEWEEMVVAWEGDHTQPNPYTVPKSGVSRRLSLSIIIR